MPKNELSARAQLRSLIYIVRWELGINPSVFLNETMEGDRWFIWAAGSVSIVTTAIVLCTNAIILIQGEELASALLLARGAALAQRRRSWRRAAMLYVIAARRLEKTGIVGSFTALALYTLTRNNSETSDTLLSEESIYRISSASGKETFTAFQRRRRSTTWTYQCF